MKKGSTILLNFLVLLLASGQVNAFAPSAGLLQQHRPAVNEEPLVPTRPLPYNYRQPMHAPKFLSSSSLKAIPPAVVSAIGHVIGGNLATPFVIGAVSTWYARIQLPSWNPPNGVFAPTWIALYSMMGVAAARMAAIQGWKSPTLMLWWGHYLLNLVWAPLFFGFAKLRVACVVSAAMAASMPFIIARYAAVDRTAALLLLPYTAWITFATVLNAAICKLNPVDNDGYSEAKLQMQIANLQKEAGKKVGL